MRKHKAQPANDYPGISRRTASRLAPFALCAIALAGCGGGGGNGTSPEAAPPVQGRVIDGYLVGAQVYWDCNDNHRIDDAEPWVTSTAGGRYTIAAAPSPSCLLRAVVPAWAQDESTGTSVGREYRLSSMAGQPELITPITSMVTDGGYSPEQIAALIGFGVQPGQDYIAAGAGGVRSANVAGVIAVGLASLNGTMQEATADGRAAAYRNLLALYPTDAFNVSATSPNSSAWLASVQGSLPVWETFLSGFRAPEHRFVLEDVAKSGLCDGVTEAKCEERKTFVRGALALAEKYRASEGRTINWGAVPVDERRRLGAADVVPSNPQVEDLRRELQLKVEQFGRDQRAAQSQFDLQGKTILLGNAFSIAVRSLDFATTSAELISPAAKAAFGTYKSLDGPKKLQTAIRHLRDVTAKGQLLKRLATDAECALQLSHDAFTVFTEVSVEGWNARTLFDTTGHVAKCLLKAVNSEKLQGIVALSFGSAAYALDSADFGLFSATQIRALTTAQIAAMDTGDLSTLNVEQVSWLSTAQVRAMNATALDALTTTQAQSLTTLQIAVLSATGLGALEDHNPFVAFLLAFGLQLLRLGGDRDRGRGFDPRQRV